MFWFVLFIDFEFAHCWIFFGFCVDISQSHIKKDDPPFVILQDRGGWFHDLIYKLVVKNWRQELGRGWRLSG